MKIIIKALNINKQKGFFMKISNLIITPSLCFLLLSPASIFGMKQMDNVKKKIEEGTKSLLTKKKKKQVVAEVATSATTNKTNLILEPDDKSDNKPEDETPKSDKNKTKPPVPLRRIELSQKRLLTRMFSDTYRGTIKNTIREMQNNLPDAFNRERVNFVIKKCSSDGNVTSLITILKLCFDKKRIILDTEVTKIAYKILEDEKTRSKIIFSEKVNKNYADGSKVLNQLMKNLKEDYAARVKIIEGMMSSYINNDNKFFETHDTKKKKIEDVLATLKNHQDQENMLLCKRRLLAKNNDEQSKLDINSIFAKYYLDDKKSTEDPDNKKYFVFSNQFKTEAEKRFNKFNETTKTFDKITPIPPIQANLEQQDLLEL